jgi:acyl-CoA thioester hydrolase
MAARAGRLHDVSRPVPFVHPVTVRYLEVDRQGVVFNMWYLAYFDDAMTAFLAAGGLPYGDLLDAGYDVQLVHTELDWRGPLGFGDTADVQVRVVQVGRTSFTLGFTVMSSDRLVAEASTVYVSVVTDGSGKTEHPTALRTALGLVDRPTD